MLPCIESSEICPRVINWFSKPCNESEMKINTSVFEVIKLLAIGQGALGEGISEKFNVKYMKTQYIYLPIYR